MIINYGSLKYKIQMLKTPKPGHQIFEKPQPQSIKLSQSALAQHNKITQLTEENELLLIKVKKCKQAVQNHDRNKNNKMGEIENFQRQLKELRAENEKLEAEERGVKERIKEDYQVIDEAAKRVKDYMGSNQRMERQCIEIQAYIEQAKAQSQTLKAKIGKKQQIYQQSQKNIHEYLQEKKKLQADIAEVEKQIRKVEDLLKQYKDVR